MSFLEAIISGIIQGITEFLPISSSGHLVIFHNLIGLKDPQIFFDIFLHLGTLIAIFIVFGKDIVDVFTVKKKYLFFLSLATLVTVVFILFFNKNIEAAFSSVKSVGKMLIFTGIWLILGSFIRFGSEGFSGFKAVLIGLAQGISALPGISRSGATISTGLFLGIGPQNAARFSFLLAIPVIIGAFLIKLKGVNTAEFNINYIFGLISSCITGILSLKLLLKCLYKNRFHLFGIYCIVMGVLVLLFLKT
jgi:undecaprenyl-diphosphatase